MAMKQRKKALPSPENEKAVTAYEQTPEEQKAIKAFRAAQKAKIPAPNLKITEDGQVCLDHPDLGVGWLLLSQATATTSMEFLEGIISQLANVVTIGSKPDQRGTNFALAVVKGISPRDQLETMLAAQMAAIHLTTMTFARRLAHAESIPQQDSAERALNKLARTFTTQMEKLKRYRTGGEQKVTVHHVTVNEGGQAIVGTVGRSGDRGEG
jgi:hypothetical protein